MFRMLAPCLLLSLMAATGCQPSSSADDTDHAVDRDEPAPKATDEVRASLLDGRYVDLTHPFNDKTIYWPTADGFRFTEQTAGESPGGYFYAANSFSTAEHGGTHIDAPIHFAAKHQTVDQIPLERLIGEAVVVDVSEKCEQEPDYQIGIEDLRAWEEKHERQLFDVILLLRTGYGRHWPDRKKYIGTEEQGPDAVKKLHFPGLHPDAAKWLAEHRRPLAVGIDTASIDYGPSRKFQTHVTLFEHHIPALENVAHLDALPATGFHVIALPMKIGGGSGGPTRIVAVLPKSEAVTP